MNENEIGLVLSHLSKLCILQNSENIFRGVLLNRFPPTADQVTRQSMLQYYTQSDFVQDAATGVWCPLDKRMMQRALRENPDKENFYPV